MVFGINPDTIRKASMSSQETKSLSPILDVIKPITLRNIENPSMPSNMSRSTGHPITAISSRLNDKVEFQSEESEYLADTTIWISKLSNRVTCYHENCIASFKFDENKSVDGITL